MAIEEIELQDLSGNTASANSNSEEEERLLKKTRLFGIIIASVTAAQAVIFIIIAVLALSCVFGKCGSGALAAGFDSMYTDLGKSSSSVVFTVLVIIHLILCITWLISSCRVISELKLFFNNYTSIKAAEKFWTVMTFIVCVFDLILFIIFLVDAVRGHGSVNIRSVDTRAAPTGKCEVITVNPSTFMKVVQDDTRANFSCNDGFSLLGPKTLTCVNGQWEPDVFSGMRCVNVTRPDDCTKFDKRTIFPENHVKMTSGNKKKMKFECDGNSPFFYGTAIATCDNGYWYPDVDFLAMKCDWQSGGAMTQLWKKCKENPTYPSFCSIFNITHGGIPGSITYLNCTCSYPDIFIGSKEAICSEHNNSQWIWRKYPNCLRAPTPPPPTQPPRPTKSSAARKNGGSGNLSGPPLVCLVVALKGFVFWILNIIMLIYLVNIMKNLTGTNCPCNTQDDSLNTTST